jgi:hypothetical protein
MDGTRWGTGVLVTLAAVAACSFDQYGTVGEGGDATVPFGAADAGPRVDAAPGTPDAALPPDAQTPAAGRIESTYRPGIELDGYVSDWAGVPRHRFDIADAQDYHQGHASYVPSAVLSFAAAHDDANIYFLLEVEDDVVVETPFDPPAVPPESYRLTDDDSISLFIDGAGDRSGWYGIDDHELVVTANGWYSDQSQPDAADVQGVPVRTPDGYLLELGVARASLGTDLLPDELGFSVAINDDDGYGNDWFDALGLWYWNTDDTCPGCCSGMAHAEAWCDTTTLGQLQLSP